MLKSYLFQNHVKLFLIMLMLIGLFATGGAQEGTSEVTNNERVALDFLAARGNWDAEALKATLADELESYDIAATAADYDDALSYYEAVNWNWTATGCEEDSSNIEQVSCNAELENDWTRALDIGPFSMTFNFVVQNGKITTIDPQWNQEFIQQGLRGFLGYLEESHPDDFKLLYGSGQHFLPRGEEALDVLKLRTAEFAAAQE